MKMKTTELQGAALDWAVAKCEGYVVEFRYSHHRNESWVVCDMNQDCRPPDDSDEGRWQMFVPSNVWQDGGPIISQERIRLDPRGVWVAGHDSSNDEYSGSTPLIAAMRCYVASQLGDEVDIPDFSI